MMEIKPVSSPPSTSDSQNSATHSIYPKREVDDVPTNNNGVFDMFEQKPEGKPDLMPQHFQVLKSGDYIEKYQKYEANYTRRLMAKYFSKNNLYGGKIFDEKITIENETIMSSRSPCTRTFAYPVLSFVDQNIGALTAENPSNISNGKSTPKKNG